LNPFHARPRQNEDVGEPLRQRMDLGKKHPPSPELSNRERKSTVSLDNYFWYIVVGGIVVLVSLVGLLLFLRNQGED
jgi:hypothetical protein